jgi:hypothetical protein
MSAVLQTTGNVRGKASKINFFPKEPFHAGWNSIAGLCVDQGALTIDADTYFIRREEATWTYVPWELVQASWYDIRETIDTALEQTALRFIADNRRVTSDAAVVLQNAEQVYSYLFNKERLTAYDDLSDVSEDDLRILRESSILCSLNKVALNGRITVIGPAWYFAQCARKVFNIDHAAEMRVDELFHGGFFNGARLLDQVRAHVALGGKLVHGCQGTGNGSGGCVVAYGTDVQVMQRELVDLRSPILNTFQRA